MVKSALRAEARVESRILSKVFGVFCLGWLVFLVFVHQHLNDSVLQLYARNQSFNKAQFAAILEQAENRLQQIARTVLTTLPAPDAGGALAVGQVVASLDQGWSGLEKPPDFLAMHFLAEDGRLLAGWGDVPEHAAGHDVEPARLLQAERERRSITYLSCHELCFFTLVRTLDADSDGLGYLHLSIPVENLLRQFEFLVGPGIFLFRRQTGIAQPDRLQYVFQAASSQVRWLKYRDLLAGLDWQEAVYQRTLLAQELLLGRLDIGYFADNPYLFVTAEDMTRNFDQAGSAFARILLGSLLVMLLLCMILYFFIHHVIRRLQFLAGVLPVIGAGQFEQAEKLLERSRPATHVRQDELDFMHQSVRVLNGRLMQLHTSLRSQNDQLRVLADFDGMTGLWNRRRFRQELESWRREGRPFYLALFDLDHFKVINDTLGHAAGDHVLAAFSDVLREEVSGEGLLLARMGGDEFAMAMRGNSRAEVEALLGRIVRLWLQSPLWSRGLRMVVKSKPSIGVAGFPADSGNMEELLVCADTAMYENKRLKQADFHFYTGRELIVFQERQLTNWLNHLTQAFQQERFLVYFQPIVSQTGHARVACEALVRIRCQEQDGGVLHAGHFIAYAEQTNLIVRIDRLVLDQALACLCSHQPQPVLFFNVSNNTLSTPGFDAYILDKLEEYGYDPACLVIELTESAEIVNFRQAESFINGLRHAGIRFALDDFGTGFSSFNYISKLELDFIKIDKSIVWGLLAASEYTKNRGIVESIVYLARAAGMQVILEGVETPEVLERIEGLGADLLQGYLFGQPSASI